MRIARAHNKTDKDRQVGRKIEQDIETEQRVAHHGKMSGDRLA